MMVSVIGKTKKKKINIYFSLVLNSTLGKIQLNSLKIKFIKFCLIKKTVKNINEAVDSVEKKYKNHMFNKYKKITAI